MPEKHFANIYPAIYAQLLPTIRQVAKDCGWGIGIHGSMLKDLDIIAIPWTDEALQGKEMVEKVCEAIGGKVGYRSGFAPGKRQGYSIILDFYAHGDIVEGYLDFSISDAREA